MRRILQYLLPWGLPALMFFGLETIWNGQMGAWAAGGTSVFSNVAIDFSVLFAAFALLFPLRKLLKLKNIHIWLLGTFFIFSQILCIANAWECIAGKMGQGIDHPAFLFRLHEFFAVFPNAVGSYNPWWNGGTEHFIGVTSGAHNFGFIMSPFLLFMPLETAYSAALLFWLAVGFPWLTVIMFRRTGMRLEGALTAGLTMLAFSRAEFLFFWQSGNLGGMVAAMLAPSIVAIGYRIAVQRHGTATDVVLLAVFAWLSCIWTPGFFTCGGLFLSWLLVYRRWTRKSVIQMLVAGAAALLLLSPWVWATLFPAKGIVDYVTNEGSPHETFIQMLNIGIGQYLKRIREWHPVITVFGIGGLFLLPGKYIRRWMLPVFLILSAVTICIGFRRTSQLDRVAIQMAGAMVFPAAVYSGRMIKTIAGKKSFRQYSNRFACCAICAALVIGGHVASEHFANRSGFKFWPANQNLYDYAEWINSNVPKEGRFAFAGITDCKFEWGKPTYLPILCDREMMSDDYYGYPKGLTERNYPPKYYRKSTEAFVFFSDTYGITHWAVTDSRNKGFFDTQTNLFELVDYRMLQSTHIYTYRRTMTSPASKTFLGSGTVTAKENEIVIVPTNVSSNDEIVIRYNWRPGLRCKTHGSEIFPYKVDKNLTFIGIRPNGNDKVIIRYRPTWHRLLPNFDGSFHH